MREVLVRYNIIMFFLVLKATNDIIRDLKSPQRKVFKLTLPMVISVF